MRVWSKEGNMGGGEGGGGGGGGGGRTPVRFMGMPSMPRGRREGMGP